MKKRGMSIIFGSVRLLTFLVSLTLGIGLPTQAKARDPYEITVSTIPAGFASYIMGVALAEQINKNSKWLKATAMEGRGPAEHMKTLIKKPEKRENYLFFNTTWDIWEAKKQLGTYNGFPFSCDEFRFVCPLGIAGNGLCALDPNIKSLKQAHPNCR